MISEFKKRPEETNDQYIHRVCPLREQNGLSWQRLADIINAECGLNHSESKYRKDYARERAAYYTGVAEAAEEEESPSYFSKEEEMALRQRVMTATEKTPYLRELRQDARFERFYRLIAEQLKELPPPEGVANEAKYFPRSEAKEYLLTLADLHFGAAFESINNKYNMDIAEERLGLIVAYLRSFVEEHAVNTIKILSLGDIVQGILRISDLRVNETAVVDAFVRAMRALASFLNEVSAFVNIEFYQVCYSNHDQLRPLGTKASELAKEDMGKILFAYLQDTLRNNPRIALYGDTEKDYLEFKIFDFNCIALHGHQIKSIENAYKDLANRHHVFYDYIFLGHSHSAKTIINSEGFGHDCETLVGGSICGSDGYADRLMVGSKASASIYEFEPILGRTVSYKIILN